MKINKLFLLLLFLLTVFTVGVFYLYGKKAWNIWNIPTLSPSFIDARIITAGAESYRLGFKIEMENPQDPYGRPFNLPSTWKLLFFTGLNQSHTGLMAAILIISFVIGLIVFSSQLDNFSAVLLAICAFSPPVFLAFERGNVDLFIFLLCSLSLIWIGKNQVISGAFLWVAAVLKIYPLFGLASMLNLEKKSFGRFVLYFGLSFGLYALITIENFRRTFSNTEVGYDLSYGLGVFPYYLEINSGNNALSLIVGMSLIFLTISIILLSLYGLRRSKSQLVVKETRCLSAFRLGAGIFVGTFLIGNNWDYRLIFLLFTLPQLVDWAASSNAARVTLSAVIISLFYLWLVRILPLAFYLDEFANWVMFAGLFYLVVASFPDWMKGEISLFLGRYDRKTL